MQRQQMEPTKSFGDWLDEYRKIELKTFGYRLQGDQHSTLLGFYEDGWSPADAISLVKRGARLEKWGVIAGILAVLLLGFGLVGTLGNFVLGRQWGDPIMSVVFLALGGVLVYWLVSEYAQIKKMAQG